MPLWKPIYETREWHAHQQPLNLYFPATGKKIACFRRCCCCCDSLDYFSLPGLSTDRPPHADTTALRMLSARRKTSRFEKRCGAESIQTGLQFGIRSAMTVEPCTHSTPLSHFFFFFLNYYNRYFAALLRKIDVFWMDKRQDFPFHGMERHSRANASAC